jgi:hypothetical protein
LTLQKIIFIFNKKIMEETLKASIKAKLGAPLRQIELEDIHFNEAYDDALETFYLFTNGGEPEDITVDFKIIWIKKYALANCKEYLGRIRGKFGGIVGETDNERIMDHQSLIAESLDEKATLTNLLQYL